MAAGIRSQLATDAVDVPAKPARSLRPPDKRETARRRRRESRRADSGIRRPDAPADGLVHRDQKKAGRGRSKPFPAKESIDRPRSFRHGGGNLAAGSSGDIGDLATRHPPCSRTAPNGTAYAPSTRARARKLGRVAFRASGWSVKETAVGLPCFPTSSIIPSLPVRADICLDRRRGLRRRGAAMGAAHPPVDRTPCSHACWRHGGATPSDWNAHQIVDGTGKAC
ncbi:hypothetical protein RJ55_02205 [Drechmeria coniospora]|nr:hypothetical protein RJ55_02205 [Drechmeria coniospora]